MLLWLQMLTKDRPVWRLAFFSRLEERKGIKLFVDAISHLNVSHIPNFEVSSISGEPQPVVISLHALHYMPRN